MTRSAKVFVQILAAGAIFVCAGVNAERNSVSADDVVKQSTTELNMEDGVSNGYYYGGYDDYCLLYPYAYGCGSYGYVDGYYGGYGGWGYGGYGYGRGWGGYGRGWGRGHHGGWGRGGHHGGWGRGGHHGGGHRGGGHRGGGHRR